MDSGTTTPTPARSHSLRKASADPTPPLAGPNIEPTQAAKKTTELSAVPATLGASVRGARAGPPAGRSPLHCGTTSAPSTTRPSELAERATGAGRVLATLSASEAPRLMVRQFFAAIDPPAFTAAAASSSRRRRTRSPVLISTGQAVWHMPSTAQVSTEAYSSAAARRWSRAVSPSARAAARARRTAIR
jgi:hypothetical protein